MIPEEPHLMRSMGSGMTRDTGTHRGRKGNRNGGRKNYAFLSIFKKRKKKLYF